MTPRLLTSIALLALLVPTLGTAAPLASDGALAILACERIDRANCPALSAALEQKVATAAALVAWLAKATAADARGMSRAAVALATLGDQSQASVLHTAAAKLPDGSETRVELLAAAARLGDKSAATGLLAQLAKGSPRTRVVAAGALGLLRAKQAVPTLIAALNDASQLRLQASAAQALGLIGDDRALEPLIALAGRPKVFTPARIQALDALATFRARAAVPLATQLIDHAEREVGRAALRLLTAVPTRYVEPAIAFALKTPLLRGEAARAAVAMEANTLGPLILDAAVDPGLTADERTWVLHALGTYPPTDTAARLMDRFELAEAEERKVLLKALPEVGDRSVVPRLVRALERTEGEVANYVVYALENLTEQRFGADLKAWREIAGAAEKASAPAQVPRPAATP